MASSSIPAARQSSIKCSYVCRHVEIVDEERGIGVGSSRCLEHGADGLDPAQLSGDPGDAVVVAIEARHDHNLVDHVPHIDRPGEVGHLTVDALDLGFDDLVIGQLEQPVGGERVPAQRVTLDGAPEIIEPACRLQDPGGVRMAAFRLKPCPIEGQGHEVVERTKPLGVDLVRGELVIDLSICERDQVEPFAAEQEVVAALGDDHVLVYQRRLVASDGDRDFASASVPDPLVDVHRCLLPPATRSRLAAALDRVASCAWTQTSPLVVMEPNRLELGRQQILAYRRRVNTLDERLPRGTRSLRLAAWAGLQDSMPRAAVLSIHARIAATPPAVLEDPSLVQLWGPRFSVYVVAERDRAVFSLGRMPQAAAARDAANDLADRLEALLEGGEMPFGQAGRALGMQPNALRYASPTGRVLLRWDGARQPLIRMVPPPDVDPVEARRELVRRYVHIYGPTTATAFSRWAGIGRDDGPAAFDSVRRALTAVRTPIGDAWILSKDETEFLTETAPAAPARLLPSGDSYYLLHDEARSLLVPSPTRRSLLWTSRVWPGAVLVDGDIVGTWRRSQHKVTIVPWRRLTGQERTAVEAEAASLPLPGLEREIAVSWEE